jgi:hypothetical protein
MDTPYPTLVSLSTHSPTLEPMPTSDPNLVVIFPDAVGQTTWISDPEKLSATYTASCAYDDTHSNDVGVRLEYRFTGPGQSSSWVVSWSDRGIDIAGKALVFNVRGTNGGEIFHIAVGSKGNSQEIASYSIKSTIEQNTWTTFLVSINSFFGNVVRDSVIEIKLTFKSDKLYAANSRRDGVICVDNIGFRLDTK